MAPLMNELSVNRQYGDFVLQELLGQRVAMELYRAAQQSLKRFVQFKIFALDGIYEQPETLIEEFQQYIGTVLGLEHMHLQPIYGYGVIDERHVYIAGRFMSGSLNGLLQTGALPLDRALELAQQTLLALDYIHANGFVHSSLSPRNIYLDEVGSAYIDDLELSLIVQKANTLRHLKSLLDDPYYASVEQLQCRPLDFRSDTYNFGAILYHMLTGRPPFSQGSVSFEAVLERKLRDQVLAPRRLNPAIPEALELALLRALRCDPDERYPDLKSLQADLLSVPQQLQQGATSLLARLQLLLARLRPAP